MSKDEKKKPLTGKGSGRGGARPGCGRPKGSKDKEPRVSIANKSSIQKLTEMRYDPLPEAIKLYEEIGKRISKEESSDKPSAQALNKMRETRERLLTTLTRFAYSPQPQRREEEITQAPSFSITLSDDNGVH